MQRDPGRRFQHHVRGRSNSSRCTSSAPTPIGFGRRCPHPHSTATPPAADTLALSTYRLGLCLSTGDTRSGDRAAFPAWHGYNRVPRHDLLCSIVCAHLHSCIRSATGPRPSSGPFPPGCLPRHLGGTGGPCHTHSPHHVGSADCSGNVYLLRRAVCL